MNPPIDPYAMAKERSGTGASAPSARALGCSAWHRRSTAAQTAAAHPSATRCGHEPRGPSQSEHPPQVVQFYRQRAHSTPTASTPSSACRRSSRCEHDAVLYAHASRILHLESNPGNARALVQRHGDVDVWLNPPPHSAHHEGNGLRSTSCPISACRIRPTATRRFPRTR